jgi:hypothetical protein
MIRFLWGPAPDRPFRPALRDPHGREDGNVMHFLFNV